MARFGEVIRLDNRCPRGHARASAVAMVSPALVLRIALLALLAGCGPAGTASTMQVHERATSSSTAPTPTTTVVPTTVVPATVVPATSTAPPASTAAPSPPSSRASDSKRSRAAARAGSDRLSWPCRIDETVPAQRDMRYTAFAGNLSASGLPRASVQRIAGQLPLIDANLWAYCAAERATGVPALVLAAIHYREANNDPNRSIMSGEPLGTVNPDTHQVEPGDLGANAIRAAGHLRDMARSVYGITVRVAMSPAELAYAALAYNRGSMYCRGVDNGAGQLHPMMSPYVSSGLFQDWVAMPWPDVGGSSIGSPEAWGEPASVRGRPDLRPGAYVVLRGLGSEIGIQEYEWNPSEVQIPCR